MIFALSDIFLLNISVLIKCCLLVFVVFQVSSERSTASSNFSRCCAAVAISDLVQPLLSVDTDRIMQMIHILKKASLGSANSGELMFTVKRKLKSNHLEGSTIFTPPSLVLILLSLCAA